MNSIKQIQFINILNDYHCDISEMISRLENVNDIEFLYDSISKYGYCSINNTDNFLKTDSEDGRWFAEKYCAKCPFHIRIPQFISLRECLITKFRRRCIDANTMHWKITRDFIKTVYDFLNEIK